MATLHELTTAQLRQALQLREQIESLQARLDGLLGGSSARPEAKESRPAGKRTMSASARARIAAAQKARWAKTKAPAQTASKKPAPARKTAAKGGKRNVSPEVRAKLAAAMKARWAARKKGGPAPNASAN